MATIQGIYIALFGRPADPIGLAFFNNATNNGADLSAIGDLAGTAEYQSRFEGMNNAQIVTEIYLSLFGRPPELAGLQFFVAQLESGAQNINTIAINILDGAQNEDADVVANKIAAAEAWTAAVAADPAALAAYQGQAGIDAGIAYLSGITDDEDTIPTEAELDAALSLLIAGEPPAGTPGQTFTLTAVSFLDPNAGVDDITGTVGNDTFRAITANSLNTIDILDGGAGDDVLNISAGAIGDAVFGGGTVAPVIRNIETINNADVGSVTYVGGVPTAFSKSLDLASVSGLQRLDTDFSGAATGTVGVAYANAALSTVFALNGYATVQAAGQATVSIDFAGSLSGDQTVNLALAGNIADSFTEVILEDGIENIVIDVADGNDGIITLNSADTESVTVTGAGNVTFYGLPQDIETFDASASTGDITLGVAPDATEAGWRNPSLSEDAVVTTGSGDDFLNLSRSSGDLTIDAGAGDDTVIGGSGDDTIIAGTGVNTLTGGAGDDTFVISIGSTTLGQADTITDWNNGDDTLIVGGTEMTAANTVSVATDAASYNDLLDLVNSAFAANEDAAFVYGGFDGGAGEGDFFFHDSDGDGIADAVVRVEDGSIPLIM